MSDLNMSEAIDLAVKIRCEGHDFLDLHQMTEFQGNLKDLTKENYEKLKLELLRHGFCEPISVWLHQDKYYILNGHQRARTLKMMAADGYFIPPIPVNYVAADTFKDAKEIVLALTSQYGNMTNEGLFEFLHEANIDMKFVEEHLRLPEINLEGFKEEFFDMNSTSDGSSNDTPPEKKLQECPECGHNF